MVQVTEQEEQHQKHRMSFASLKDMLRIKDPMYYAEKAVEKYYESEKDSKSLRTARIHELREIKNRLGNEFYFYADAFSTGCIRELTSKEMVAKIEAAPKEYIVQYMRIIKENIKSNPEKVDVLLGKDMDNLVRSLTRESAFNLLYALETSDYPNALTDDRVRRVVKQVPEESFVFWIHDIAKTGNVELMTNKTLLELIKKDPSFSRLYISAAEKTPSLFDEGLLNTLMRLPDDCRTTAIFYGDECEAYAATLRDGRVLEALPLLPEDRRGMYLYEAYLNSKNSRDEEHREHVIEFMTRKSTCELAKVIDTNLFSRYLGLADRTLGLTASELDTLSEAVRLSPLRSAQNLIRIVEDYKDGSPTCKLLDLLQKNGIENGLPKISEEISDAWLKALIVSYDKNPMQFNDRIIKMINGLPPENAEIWLSGMQNIKLFSPNLTPGEATRLLLRKFEAVPKDIAQFWLMGVERVGLDNGDLLLSALLNVPKDVLKVWTEELSSENVQIHTKQKVLSVLNDLPAGIRSVWIWGLRKDTEALYTSDKLVYSLSRLNDDVKTSAPLMGAWLDAVKNTGDLEFLSREEVLAYAVKNREVADKIFNSTRRATPIAIFFEYYSRLLSGVSLNTIGDMQVISDPVFVQTAYEMIKKGSTQIARYSVASMLYDADWFNAKYRTHESLKAILSSDRTAFAESDKFFKELGVSNSDLISMKEKLALSKAGYGYVKEYASRINEILNLRLAEPVYAKSFLEGRGELARRGFDTKLMDTTMSLGTITATVPAKPVEVTRTDALEMLAAINGSAKEGSRRLLLEKLQLKGHAEIVDRAIAIWAKVDDVSKHGASRATETGDIEGAFAVFRNTLRKSDKLNDLERESISDMIDMIDGALTSGTVRLGNEISAFIVRDNNNAMTIQSSITRCCAFLNGVNNWACLGYAVNPAIVLIDFSVMEKEKDKNKDPEKLPVHGVAIAALAMVEGKRSLFVDSVEYGPILNNAIQGRENELLDKIKLAARRLGAESVALYGGPGNASPNNFLKAVSGEEKYLPIELLTGDVGGRRIWDDRGPYLEGAGDVDHAAVKMIYLEQGR